MGVEVWQICSREMLCCLDTSWSLMLLSGVPAILWRVKVGQGAPANFAASAIDTGDPALLLDFAELVDSTLCLSRHGVAPRECLALPVLVLAAEFEIDRKTPFDFFSSCRCLWNYIYRVSLP